MLHRAIIGQSFNFLIGVRAYMIWNWCVNRRTHVNDVRISGGYKIDVCLKLSYMGEPELSLS